MRRSLSRAGGHSTTPPRSSPKDSADLLRTTAMSSPTVNCVLIHEPEKDQRQLPNSLGIGAEGSCRPATDYACESKRRGLLPGHAALVACYSSYRPSDGLELLSIVLIRRHCGRRQPDLQTRFRPHSKSYCNCSLKVRGRSTICWRTFSNSGASLAYENVRLSKMLRPTTISVHGLPGR